MTQILKKQEEDRTDAERNILSQSPDIAVAVQKRAKTRQLAKDRQLEVIGTFNDTGISVQPMA